MTIETRLLTGDDLLRIGQERRCELIRGELHDLTPPGEQHGEIALNVGVLLSSHTRPEKLGKVVVESGFYTARDPDTVRGPDVSFFHKDRVGSKGLPPGYGTVSPDLAVEVVSPNDGAQDVESRVLELLSAQVRAVWVIYPKTRTIHVYTGGAVHILKDTDTLSGGDVLPGFQCPVSDLFDLQS